jgi:hypothetical protein
MRQFCRNICYLLFKGLSKIKTTFFSNSFIALGYFIKSDAEFNKSIAANYKKNRRELHKEVATIYLKPDEKIHFFEFGVRWGQIINSWASYNINANSVFTGFDVFTGIPEDWGNVKKGSFSNEGAIPEPHDSRVSFCAGLVEDTLPVYLSKVDRTCKLIIHLDFDLYSATLFTLLCMQPLFKKGDIIILDEYFSITKNHHEYRAFHDFLSLHKVSYTPLFKHRSGHYVIELA